MRVLAPGGLAVCSLLLASGFVAAQAPVEKVVSLTVEPSAVLLTHAEASQRLLVSAKLSDQTLRDASRVVKYTSANPAVAVVSADGIIAPKAAGQTSIEVTTADAAVRASVVVSVTGASRRPVSFSNDVMPIFAKAGCNSGACHGAASGKKGFKVSLRGYDPVADYVALTHGTTGRRLNFNHPEASLLVLKPTGQVMHEGGRRFDARSAYAETLRRWLAEGAPSDTATAPKLTGIEIYPKFRTFPTPDLEQQLLVMAKFADGSSRDVTADARYSSSNENAVQVDEAGRVRMPSKGEAAVIARYGPMLAVGTVVVLKHNPAFTWSNPPENNYVDTHVNVKLRQLEYLPSDLTNDAEFLRRVYYDVIGVPPTSAEVRVFLADKSADKRARVIDRLLERPEHAEFWALKWGDLLKIRFDLLRDKGTWGMYRWLRDSVASNKPFDKLVREVVTAEGSCAENPAANYWRVFNNPDDAAEATAQVFFGIRLMCAKCHDHPFEKWVQKDYYGMSAFFAQVDRKTGSRKEDLVVFHTERVAQARHPTTGQILDPKYLDGVSVPVAADKDGRELLADWMTRKDNPFLARATVNRIWSHLFGRGIIDPVDDIRSSNPPVNAPLLDALTKDFIAHGFDVRHILRVMLNSRTYQLSARTNAFNADDRLNFSHALPRRLSAEQLLDTVSQATGIRPNFRARFGATGSVALPNSGLRAGQLPDRQLTTDMLELFGRPRGESTCACERHEEASMTQALHLINGKSIAERLANPGGQLARLLQQPKVTDAELVDEIYLNILCRPPAPEEKEIVLKYFAQRKDRAGAAQDAAWALFNTKEFLFNH
jgi:hypothetical protein